MGQDDKMTQDYKTASSYYDYIVRAAAADGQIRAFAAQTRDLVECARQAHGTSPVATAALGRLLTAGVMMGTMMKGEEDLLTLQIKGDGPIGGIVVTADSHGGVKGYVHHPQVLLPANAKGKLDVSGAIGKGMLQVIEDLGLKEPYQGSVALQTGEIAEDLTYYFASSEQVASSVGLGVLMEKDNTVRQAGGFIIQLMPFAPDEVIDRLEAQLKEVTSVTSMLDAGLGARQILERLLEPFDVRMTETVEAQYRCGCSKDRFAKALISIGKKDLKEMIRDGKDVEVCCHFCSRRYTFTPQELEGLLEAAR